MTSGSGFSPIELSQDGGFWSGLMLSVYSCSFHFRSSNLENPLALCRADPEDHEFKAEDTASTT